MNPDAILAAALADGLLIWPEGADTLRVRGTAAARSKWVDILRQHKPAIIRRLWVERLRDHFEERAAILEYDARMPRPEAEEQARRATALLALNLGAPWAALREVLNDSSLPDTDEPVDRLPYPLPVWCMALAPKPIRQGGRKHACNG